MWLLNEDAAMKLKLQGLTVADATSPPGGRPVQVVFRLPEVELVSLQYPCIIIEHAGILPAPEREHRGYVQIPYAPEGHNPWWNDSAKFPGFNVNGSPYYSYYPVPYNFNYQVTVYARKMAGHMQPLIAQLAAYNYIPYHFGFLNVPQDGTKRTMVLSGGPEMGYAHDEDGKRLLTTTYLVTVFSELLWPITTAGLDVPYVTDIEIDLGCYADPQDLSTAEVTQSIGIISAGMTAEWGVGYLNAIAGSNAGLHDSTNVTFT